MDAHEKIKKILVGDLKQDVINGESFTFMVNRPFIWITDSCGNTAKSTTWSFNSSDLYGISAWLVKYRKDVDFTKD